MCVAQLATYWPTTVSMKLIPWIMGQVIASKPLLMPVLLSADYESLILLGHMMKRAHKIL